MSKSDFINTYSYTKDVHIKRKTDLNEECEMLILENILVGDILEVGCGKGYLSNLLTQYGNVTAVDIAVHDRIRETKVNFVEGDIQHLQFADNSFDTVVCTHTLEHVQHLFQAINELKRVTKKRLIIVVPSQRPYKFTFDLHVHFFPYEFSLLSVMSGECSNRLCKYAGGDLFYLEDNPVPYLYS